MSRKKYLGLTADLSVGGAVFQGEAVAELIRNEQVDVAIYLPNMVLRCKSRVSFISGSTEAGGRCSIGLEFHWSETGPLNSLEMFLFGSRLQLEMSQLGLTARTPAIWLHDLVSRRNANRLVTSDWSPGLLRDTNTGSSLPVAIARYEDGRPVLCSHVQLNTSDDSVLRRQSDNGLNDHKVRLHPSGSLPSPTGVYHLYEISTLAMTS